MNVTPVDPLLCPLDAALLRLDASGASCVAGHRFDRARAGYLNLLPVQHKASLEPGDDRTMVAARRAFLSAGHYAPITDVVFDVVRARVAAAAPEDIVAVLDAGCGGGDCLARLAERAAADTHLGALALAGIDISKRAVRAAARRLPVAAWAVASNRRLPFVDGSIDVLLCLFGFPVWAEFARVQRMGGEVLLVDPGPDHLLELREYIYPEVQRRAAPALAAALAAGYRLADEHSLRFGIVLDAPEQIGWLLTMTPHGHRLTPERRAVVMALDHLALRADVRVCRLLRT